MSRDLDTRLHRELAPALRGTLHTDRFSRGRYATDASMYQMMPLAVVIPADDSDVERTLAFARDAAVPVLPRGGGTSQCGQTVNHALVIDYSPHLSSLLDFDADAATCVVQPGIVLDELNRQLKPHGLWFPVDVSTASRATIGGMTANNSCGSRSIRYGLMRDNVLAVDALLADGSRHRFGRLGDAPGDFANGRLVRALLSLGQREREEILARFPAVMRRVGGYNIDALLDDGDEINLAHLLVGSEGTLAMSERCTLKLSPLPRNRMLGVCHFPTFHDAMDAAQHIVTLSPTAVELIDRTMIELSRDIPIYRPTVEQFVRGEPDALLLVEFAEDDDAENRRRLDGLNDLMHQLGFDFDHPPARRGGVVEAVDRTFQAAIFEVRKSGLNIMMSMKDDRKPISFVEDCAVALPDLAEYTARLTEIFHKHNTRGTWYAHASVGCLHVRPVLNLRLTEDVRAMRAIAEECFDMVLAYKGSHSGEHGDGLCRSEFHEKMFGKRMVDNFREVKHLFDPDNVLNPGKIVDPPAMDDRSLFRYPPGYHVPAMHTVLDWSSYSGAGGGFQGAVEMCNNNGACRKLAGGAMCPSYRATRDEQHLTRGRANSLRLALSGQLGEDALVSEQMADTMKLCVSCKACKRECPTGIDMARMKIEVMAARHARHGASLHDRLVAHLPRYAPWMARVPALANLPSRWSTLRAWLEPLTGFSRHRALPTWHGDAYRHGESSGPADGPPVVLFADTFNTWFEPDNLRSARTLLAAAGYRVVTPLPDGERRPLCCGRTYLTTGMVGQARTEMQRMLDTLLPWLERGATVVGLEPSCLLALRDEVPALLKSESAARLAENALLFEEFWHREQPDLPLAPVAEKAYLHGHCHQKAFHAMGPVQAVLETVPGLSVTAIESSCCGMAGAFGYGRDTVEMSLRMGEAALLPAVREAPPGALIVADGTSCRHQIADGAQREAVHVARVLERSLRAAEARA